MIELYPNQTVTSITTKEICHFSNCNFCQKLNDIGNQLFPKATMGKDFDKFCELFYHQITERK